MAIFSRRSLQYMINENAKILRTNQLKRHVDALNKADESSLAVEWEVAMLYGFGQHGKVDYEPDLGGKRKPDLYFTSNTKPRQSFIADITTISDKSYEAENPIEDFFKELLKNIRKKYALSVDGFSFKVGGKKEGTFHSHKIKLMLPTKGKLQNIFCDKKFKDFLSMVKEKPNSVHSFTIKTDSTDILISYDPRQRNFIGEYPSYKTVYSLTKNPVYNTLKAKVKQLKETGYDGPKVIILCDGGCSLLHDKGYTRLNYGFQDVIQHFLKQNSSISFVLTCVVKRPTDYPYFMGKPYIEIRKVDKELLTYVNKLCQLLPKPVNDAKNAIKHLRTKKQKEGLSFYGGCQMTGKLHVRISSRALHELLAGKVEQKKFLEDHRFTPTKTHPDATNPFELRLSEGRMIKKIKIEKSETQDDDWVIFEFGGPDPAISQFKLPQTSVLKRLWNRFCSNSTGKVIQ